MSSLIKASVWTGEDEELQTVLQDAETHWRCERAAVVEAAP